MAFGYSSKDRLGKKTGLVIRTGKRIHSQGIVLYIRESSHPCFAAVIGKKYAGSVKRNRVKRMSREIFRKIKNLMKPYDIVLIFRKDYSDIDYSELKNILEKLFYEAGVLEQECL